MVYSQIVKYDPEKRISLTELKKLLNPLLSKKCLGTSLGGSNGKKRKAERTSSVQAVIRRINNKTIRKTKPEDKVKPQQ